MEVKEYRSDQMLSFYMDLQKSVAQTGLAPYMFDETFTNSLWQACLYGLEQYDGRYLFVRLGPIQKKLVSALPTSFIVPTPPEGVSPMDYINTPGILNKYQPNFNYADVYFQGNPRGADLTFYVRGPEAELYLNMIINEYYSSKPFNKDILVTKRLFDRQRRAFYYEGKQEGR